jgi:hypothetical protein
MGQKNGSDMHVNFANIAIANLLLALKMLAVLLFVFTSPISNSQTSAKYDGKSPLQCGTNVNCANQADVVAKMKVRWVTYSSKTNYSDPCFKAINRVQGINAQVWDAGMAQQQMEVCNMQ